MIGATRSTTKFYLLALAGAVMASAQPTTTCTSSNVPGATPAPVVAPAFVPVVEPSAIPAAVPTSTSCTSSVPEATPVQIPVVAPATAPDYGGTGQGPVPAGFDVLPFCDEVNPSSFTPIPVVPGNYTQAVATYGQGAIVPNGQEVPPSTTVTPTDPAASNGAIPGGDANATAAPADVAGTFTLDPNALPNATPASAAGVASDPFDGAASPKMMTGSALMATASAMLLAML